MHSDFRGGFWPKNQTNPFLPPDRHLAGQGEEGMTGKMPVLLSVAAAGEVTGLCRLQWQPADACDRIIATKYRPNAMRVLTDAGML